MIFKILMILAWIYIIFGIIGIFRFSNIYARLLMSSKIDTAAMITILTALMIKSGWNAMTVKLLLILLFILITSPVGTHIIARSAYLNGVDLKKDDRS